MVESIMLTLTQEEVNGICVKALEAQIGSSTYQHTEAVKWNQEVVESVTGSLVRLERPYKYCVCCIIMQAGLGAGLNVASMCFWDKQTDHSFVVRWESKAVIAVCNIYALRHIDANLPAPVTTNIKNENASDVEQHVSNGGS